MAKKIFFLEIIFLFYAFFCIDSVYAVNLEVAYPVVQGQVLGSTTTLPAYAKYLFNLGMFLGFFSVLVSFIIAGVMYFISPALPSGDLLGKAKDRISGAITGLLLLTFIYLIVVTINPSLSIFHINELETTTPHTEDPLPGVYFHKQKACADTTQPNLSSIPDLGEGLKNQINSVGIIQGDDAYISVLYDNINFKGKCQYLNPNERCQDVAPFAASASIYKFDFEPNGDGVYFYRKSYFNSDGGYYKVQNSDIKGIYTQKLENLKFVDRSAVSRENPEGCTVPKNERDCIKYNEDGACTLRACPTLAGENISSMKINGNYFVLPIYFGPADTSKGPWTSCQAFPALDDINKLGPPQIKWKSIRNTSGVIPNWVIIIPVKEK